jgi:hypothetical protein
MICPHCHLEDRGGLHSADFCIERLAEIIRRVPVVGGMILPREPVDHDAYRKGLCASCSSAQRSAGLPRCAPCHDKWIAALPTFEPGLEPGKLAPCGATDCGNPTMPGRVRCGPCFRDREAQS